MKHPINLINPDWAICVVGEDLRRCNDSIQKYGDRLNPVVKLRANRAAAFLVRVSELESSFAKWFCPRKRARRIAVNMAYKELLKN